MEHIQEKEKDTKDASRLRSRDKNDSLSHFVDQREDWQRFE